MFMFLALLLCLIYALKEKPAPQSIVVEQPSIHQVEESIAIEEPISQPQKKVWSRQELDAWRENVRQCDADHQRIWSTKAA